MVKAVVIRHGDAAGEWARGEIQRRIDKGVPGAEMLYEDELTNPDPPAGLRSVRLGGARGAMPVERCIGVPLRGPLAAGGEDSRGGQGRARRAGAAELEAGHGC